jgi:hypothetical protein
LESTGYDFSLDYSGICDCVREDIQNSHHRILDALRRPGAWLTGCERRNIAKESRNALDCPLCRERKAALSPEHVRGDHATVTDLPQHVVEVIHRIRTDSGRLSRSWFEKRLSSGIEVETYVEIVGIVTLLAGIDCFCKAIGLAPFPLPEVIDGEPSRHRPAGTRDDVAWVPMLMPEDATGPEADLYPDLPMVPNIARALSLVPQQARLLQDWTASHYVDLAQLQNPMLGRDLDRVQIELVAARVSALNECFY